MAAKKKNAAPRTEAAPANETKAQKFSRLASKRVTKALNAIKNVGALASRNYEYTPEQVSKIREALREGVEAVEHKFEAPKEAPKGATFTV